MSTANEKSPASATEGGHEGQENSARDLSAEDNGKSVENFSDAASRADALTDDEREVLEHAACFLHTKAATALRKLLAASPVEQPAAAPIDDEVEAAARRDDVNAGWALYERLHASMPDWYPDAWEDLLPKYQRAYTDAAATRSPAIAAEAVATPTAEEVIVLLQRAVREHPATFATEVWRVTPTQIAWVVGMLRKTAAPQPPAQADARGAAAVRTLETKGYTYTEGAELWRPPLGKAPAWLKHDTQAVHDVIAERRRQIEQEGWTPEHDDEHDNCEMALAAIVYAESAVGYHATCPDTWPWSPTWFKSTTPRRDLVKACALALAEIERLDRTAARAGAQS
ncbi:hypothetical protein [Burkholderia sp. BCC1988]|uniref:hypothetical protein n=1 Tax=Burkholderia sp. BCC1988 TaxID=2817443 RepID=UPI002AB1261E|nr:hypothetical protein [Burkholderia sp. BCC1988]